jgi:iron(III) transport system permease protein
MLTSPIWVENLEQTDGYGSLFDSRHIKLALNSLGLAGGTTALCLVTGVPLAFLFSRTNLWAGGIFRCIYIIPIFIPPYIHAIVWNYLSGYIKEYLSLNIHSLWGVIFVLSLAYFPFVTLTTLSGLKSIDRNLEEVSLLYHGRWQTLTRITLPLVTPHIFSGAIFVFIFSLTNFGVPDILRVSVYPVEIFVQFSAFFNEKAATLLSLPLIAITILLIVLQKRYMKDRYYVQVSGGYTKAIRYHLGKLNIFAFGLCFVIFGLSVCLPISVLLGVAGSFSSYVRVLGTSTDQIVYSLVLAFSGALFAVLLGFSISYLIARTKAIVKVPIEYASFIPLAIPATTLGIGLIKVWNHPLVDLVYGSSLIIIFGYIARFVPFSTIMISSGLRQVNHSLEEVAFLNVASWAKVIRKIVLPLSRPSIIAGFFIVFVLSFGELGMTLLVIPPGRETIPIKIYNLMHYGADQMVAALCLILIAIIFTFYGLFFFVHRKLVKGI